MLNRKLLVSAISLSVFSLCNAMQTAYASDNSEQDNNVVIHQESLSQNYQFTKNINSSRRFINLQRDALSHGTHCYVRVAGSIFEFHC